jgi:Holliday junction resolvase RusA-like endonuclease
LRGARSSAEEHIFRSGSLRHDCGAATTGLAAIGVPARNTVTVVRLSPQTERDDALNVLAADRRELALQVHGEQPLRKPTTRAQKKRIEGLRAQAAVQIEEQLTAAARRAFRGRIAVELRVRVTEGRGVPDLRKMVKDYVDLLVGSVVDDDSRVDHLLVLLDSATHEGVDVTVRCLPLSIFEAEFDRAFRTLDHGAVMSTVTPEGRTEAHAPFLDAAPNPSWRWGLRRFGRVDQDALARDEGLLDLLTSLNEDEDEQLAEDEDACVDLDIPAGYEEFADRFARDNMIDHLVEAIAVARGNWLVDQGFDARDRPGAFPAWLTETIELDAADVVLLSHEGPGCFVLPAPSNRRTRADERRWDDAVTREFASRLGYGPWAGARFVGDIALDIALRGNAGLHGDVDNFAHRIIGALEKAFDRHEPLRIRGYRIYRQRWHEDNVRVRLVPKIRLEALAASMDLAREAARHERGERARR